MKIRTAKPLGGLIVDIHDKLEHAEEDIFNVSEAVEYLERVQGMEDMIDMLKDRLIVLSFKRDEYHKMAEAEDARDEAALTREYWRMVM